MWSASDRRDMRTHTNCHTDNTYTWNGASDTRGDLVAESLLYDPRCRGWYQNALELTFTGTVSQAFPTTSGFQGWFDGTDAKGDVSCVATCDTARTSFAEMFNVTVNTTSRVTIPTSSLTRTKQTDITWNRYIFFTGGTMGLTVLCGFVSVVNQFSFLLAVVCQASRAIQNITTGELIAVVAIDYTLHVCTFCFLLLEGCVWVVQDLSTFFEYSFARQPVAFLDF